MKKKNKLSEEKEEKKEISKEQWGKYPNWMNPHKKHLFKEN